LGVSSRQVKNSLVHTLKANDEQNTDENYFKKPKLANYEKSPQKSI
jgi:hypothetical protein